MIDTVYLLIGVFRSLILAAKNPKLGTAGCAGLSHPFVRVSGFCAQLSLLSWPPPGSSQRVIILHHVFEVCPVQYDFPLTSVSQ
jgi:hypothetical protein